MCTGENEASVCVGVCVSVCVFLYITARAFIVRAV